MSNNYVSPREVKEGLQFQGVNESWSYRIDVAPVQGTPTGTPTITIYDEADYSNVTSQHTTTSNCTLSGTIITTPLISNLRLHRTYRCLVTWSVGSSGTRSRYFRLRAEL